MSGAVGMIGKSWGGFNGLQIAARQPPTLKAIVAGYSTETVMPTMRTTWAAVCSPLRCSSGGSGR
jgi:predicted acyl esterase